MTRLSFSKNKAEQEYVFINECIYHKQIPNLCVLFGAFLPKVITLVPDANDRMILTDQYRRIIDKTKYEITGVVAKAAHAVREHNRKELNSFVADTWSNQRRLPDSERLSKEMVDIIEQRQRNIDLCVKKLYNSKPEFFMHVPTVIMRHFPRY